MKKELLIGLSWLGSMAAMAGGSGTPPAYEVDTVFSSNRNARTIYVANNKLNPLGVVQDDAGNVWIGGSYNDNTNNFNKAIVAAFNGTNGVPLTSYNNNGVYYHNQYDFDFVRSLYKVRGGKVYAAFTTAGGALLDANSTGLGVNKAGLGMAPQCRAYAQRNDSTIVGVTAMGGANPPQNRFYAFNAVRGTDYNSHLFANYYNGSADNFNSILSSARVIAIQPDGKMLVATTPFEIYRYKANSSQLDSTFGTNGYAYITPNNPPTNPCDAPQATDMKVRPDGSILYLLGNGAYSQLYLLNSNGTVDNTFANNTGVISLNMGYTALVPCTYNGTVCTKIALLSNGKIILGGTELSEVPITYSPQGVVVMNGNGLGFYGFNADGSPDYDFGSGSYYQRINVWRGDFSGYEFPQLNEMYVNAADEIFVTGRYAVSVAGAPSAEDAAFIMKLKPTPVANACASYNIEVEGSPAQNQSNSDGVITISHVTGIGPYNVEVNVNGNVYTSGSYPDLPVVIENIPADTSSYSVIIANAAGCSDTAYVTVAGCYNFRALVGPSATSGAGACDGNATVTISGTWGGPFMAIGNFLGQIVDFNSTSYTFSNTLCADSAYTLTVADGYGCTVTDTFDITVGCTAPPMPVVAQSNDTLFASIIDVTGGYDWYLDGNVIATTNFPVNYLVVTQNGSYTVVAGNGPCISNPSEPFVVTTVDVRNIAEAGFAVYPNPAKDVLLLNCNEQIRGVEVYNMMGAQVIAEGGSVTHLNVAGLNKGIYSIKVSTIHDTVVIRSFAKD